MCATLCAAVHPARASTIQSAKEKIKYKKAIRASAEQTFGYVDKNRCARILRSTLYTAYKLPMKNNNGINYVCSLIVSDSRHFFSFRFLTVAVRSAA